MNRRQFIGTSLAGAAAVSATMSHSAQAAGKHDFKLKYAPHFGMFKQSAGQDLIDQLKFMADQGFRALEDNGMRKKSVDMQNTIAKEMTRLNMEMGVFVATADFNNVTFATDDKDVVEKIMADMRDSVEVAKRVNAKYCTVVPGRFDLGLEWDYQTALVIENLKRCAEICEPSGLVMVLEPLNPWANHPGLFLTKIPQAYMICRGVNSPSCKILFDIYHQQITEGNLIPNMERAWSEIGYFQVGDNPGRKEPGTGEINYKNIFQWIYKKDPSLIVGMEHGNSKPGTEGEKAVIQAYVQADSFQV
ncbi:TIM barrel protein [candidate division KSB1 bacterium]|nr:TIM barrel protein [candidate division KSB1 bacterium]